MNDKEYTYDIDKYTIGVDTNGEDEIGMTIAIIKNGEINFLGNCYGENARCIDLLIKEKQEQKLELSGYRQAILNNKEMLGLKEQNDKLKKQVENYKKLGFKHLQDKNNNLETQQKEFIKWLEEKEKRFDMIGDPINSGACCGILQKYKKIIGVSDENNIK